MWRRWLSYLLLAVVLVSQHGMLLHSLGHAMADAQPSFAQGGSAPQQSPADKACDACVAFVQLAGAITAHATPPTLLGHLSYALTPSPTLPASTTELPLPRSRGPPAFA